MQSDTHTFVVKSNPNFNGAHNASDIYLPNGRLRYWQCIRRSRPNRGQLYLLIRTRDDIFRNIFERHGLTFQPLKKRNMFTSICAIVETNKIRAYCILLSNLKRIDTILWNSQRLSLDLYLRNPQ